MGGNGWNEYSRRAYRRALEMDPTRPTCLTSPTCPEARYALRMKTILMTGIAGALVLAAGAALAARAPGAAGAIAATPIAAW